MLETRIEHLGHTSFAFSRGERRILIDPIVVLKELDFRRPGFPQWFYDDLSGFDAIFISHGHNDHLHPPSLLGFPRDVPVYFLAEDLTTCSCDEDPRELLPHLGFRDIRPFEPGDVVELADDLRIHIVPAQESSEGEEQCCFLIETPDVLMLDAVDIQDHPVTRAALESYRGRIDIAFVPTGAAVQWQGFWNQMDKVEALAFIDWLRPARAATCGGSLSLAGRPRPGLLERYPDDLASWLATAISRNGAGERLIAERAPLRLRYRSHRLESLESMRPATRFSGADGTVRPHPSVTAFFTGYHPTIPSKRLCWPDDALRDWLAPLLSIRELVRASRGQLRDLVERCDVSANRSPAAVLAPCTLRRLAAARRLDLAARLTAHIPDLPERPEDLEMSFFAVIEALVESDEPADELLRRELRTCLWIDRGMFHLWIEHLRLKSLTSYSEEEAERLRGRHLEGLRESAAARRPALTAMHFFLERDQVQLLSGAPPPPEVAAMLCYAGCGGVYSYPLSQFEALVLELCDGRAFAEVVSHVAAALDMPDREVDQAVFSILSRLSSSSVLLVDWSR